MNTAPHGFPPPPLPVGNWMPPQEPRHSPNRMYQQFQQDGIHPMSHAGQFPYPNAPAPGPAPRWKNGMGTASLVLGILATAFAFLPIIGVVAWPLGILGLIFGIVGLSRVKKGRADNKPIAIAGTICSALGLLICFLWVGAIASTDPAHVTPLGAPVVPSAPVAGGLQTETWTVDTDAHRDLPPVGTYADGKYEVGAEIEPGTYKTDGPPADSYSGSCYWAKYSDASGDMNSLKSNEIVSGRSTVTIKPGGYVEFSGGCLWTKK